MPNAFRPIASVHYLGSRIEPFCTSRPITVQRSILSSKRRLGSHVYGDIFVIHLTFRVTVLCNFSRDAFCCTDRCVAQLDKDKGSAMFLIKSQNNLGAWWPSGLGHRRVPYGSVIRSSRLTRVQIRGPASFALCLSPHLLPISP